MRKHAVLSYFVLAFAFSWSYWLYLLLKGDRVQPGSSATHLPGLLGPFLAALVVTAVVDGVGGLRCLLLSCVRLPSPRLPSLLLATSPLLFGVAAYAILSLFGVPPPTLDDLNTYPGVPEGWPPAASLLFVLILNGIGEEGGWRGFALPRLARGRSKLHASLLVAGMWLLWHLPLFALNASMAALLGPALLGWALGLASGSIVLAWIFFRVQSVFVVAIWHTSFNLLVATAPGRGLVAALASTIVMVLGVLIAARWLWWRDLPNSEGPLSTVSSEGECRRLDSRAAGGPAGSSTSRNEASKSR
jgi:membrane protease YdiL (CAAX protease family)